MQLVAPVAYDLVIKGGRVVDPANNIDAVLDVAVFGGLVAAVGKGRHSPLATRHTRHSSLATVELQSRLHGPPLLQHTLTHPRARTRDYVRVGHNRADVGAGGRAAFDADLSLDAAKEVFDATGFIVTPGLIDTHVHCYDGVAPYGVDADEHCLARGSTTVLDCGDAGCNNLAGLKKHVARRTATRVLAVMHISNSGLVTPDPYGCNSRRRDWHSAGTPPVPLFGVSIRDKQGVSSK